MNIKISVIIPVYNVQDYLEECLLHVINQTYSNLEIIVVNDGSTDNSGKILAKYVDLDNRIIVINKKNGGLSSARNAGIDIATGEYLAFIDSDDYPDYDMFENLVKIIEKYKVDIAICSYYRNINEHYEGYDVYDEKIAKIDALMEISKNGKFEAHAWNKIYKKELFENIRYPEGKLYEDIFTTYQLIDQIEYIGFTSQRLYYYRVNSESITNRNYKPKDIDLVIGSIKFYDYLFENQYYDVSNVQRDSITRNSIALLNKMFRANTYISKDVLFLKEQIRLGYPKYFKSQYKLSNKIFGFLCLFSTKFMFKIVSLLNKR